MAIFVYNEWNITHNEVIRPIGVEISDLGLRLKSYRLSRNLSQEHVAQQAGITRKTLIRVLRAMDCGGRVDLLIPSVGSIR